MVKTEVYKEEYWQCVKECLVRLCGWSRQKAAARIRHLRPKVDPYKRKLSLCYHAAPIHVAEDMAGVRFGEAEYQIYLKELAGW